MPVYLDHAATTRVCPEAARAALSAMTGTYGNPSSRHAAGALAAERLQADRAAVAAALGCPAQAVYFTSGGTESNNWAIAIAGWAGRRTGRHVVTTAIEHTAVLEALKAPGRDYEVTYVKPDRSGHVPAEALRAALRPDTILVSVMLVNNELGTVQPVAEAARAVREAGSPALVHTDAVQAFCKMPVTPGELGVDLLSVSGHKLGAPKGVGALYIRPGLSAVPLLFGGGQEGGLRAGTEPMPQIAGLAAASALRKARLAEDAARMAAVKAETLALLRARVPGLVVISEGDAPHICAVSLPGYPGEMLVRALSDEGVYVSSGSACHKGKPSHVYAALDLAKDVRMGAFRVSFSPENSAEDALALCRALEKVRRERFGAMR